MDLLLGKVKRDLSERRFNKTDTNYCCTGGPNLGCPFLRTNTRKERICTLYRSKLGQALNNHFKRVALCQNNTEPQAKRHYEVCASKTVEATSSEEAKRLFCQAVKQGAVPSLAKEGDIVEFEYMI